MMKRKSLFFILLLVIFSLVLGMTACGGRKLETPRIYGISDEDLLTWSEVEDARQYEIEIVNPAGGQPRTEIVRRTSFSLSGLEDGDYEIRIRATGGSRNAVTSDWSAREFFQKGHESGMLYTLIAQGTEYAVKSVGSAEGEVVIEDEYRKKPVTEISASAFRAANHVTGVKVGKNVRTVGDNAFYNCAALTRVELPDSVTAIGKSAFQVCGKLESVRLPSALTAIPEYLFAYCRALSSVEIPEGVTSIGESAFYGCSALMEIVLPESVERVGEYAFATANALRRVRFGSKLQNIGPHAFYADPALETLEFSPLEGEMAIGDEAFSKCTALKEISLPEGTAGIGNNAFLSCKQLAAVTLPATVKKIAAYAFDGTALYKMQEENGLIYAGKWIVGATQELKRGKPQGGTAEGEEEKLRFSLVSEDFNGVSFTDDIVKVRSDTVGIASNCFAQCSALQAVRLTGVRYLCSYSFYQDPTLTDVLLPGAEIVSEYAFADCRSLGNLRFHVSFKENITLKEIESYAFYNCSGLNCQEVEAPGTLTRIGTYAFYGTQPYLMKDEQARGLVYFGDWVVGYFDKFSEIVLKENTRGIADYAFYNDDIVTTVRASSVGIVGRGAFANCYDLLNVSFGRNVREIPDYAFRNCAAMINISLPIRLERVGKYAYENCVALLQADAEGTALTQVDEGAFYGCTLLGKVTLPETVEEIGAYAFYKTALTSLELPASVRTVGERAFAMDTALESVILHEGLLEIGDFAFRGCSSLASIDLPATLSKIGRYAFYQCTALRSVTFREGLEEIGEYAFAGDIALGSVRFPATLSKIGSYAFRGCEALTYAVLPGTAVSVGKHAFNGCGKLTFYTENTNAADMAGQWNSSYCPIVLGCTFGEEGYLISVTTAGVVNPYCFFGLSAPVREGYTFAGWAEAADATEAEYSLDEICDLPAGRTLYALWTALPEEGENLQ